MSVRELRADLADVINAAGMHDQITFVTSRGRRVAAVVSVAVAEAATEDSQAAGDAATAQLYAVNVQLHEDRGGTPSLTMAEIFEDYATDLLREFGHDPDRALAAARAVAATAADKVGYPMLWRHAALAVELCERAVEITGRVLPGSYRPGSRAKDPDKLRAVKRGEDTRPRNASGGRTVAHSPYKNTEFLILEFDPHTARSKVADIAYSVRNRDDAINDARKAAASAQARSLPLRYAVVRIATEAVFPD